MHNPFETIMAELAELKELAKSTPQGTAAPVPEIINTEELCRRLALSEPTVIQMRKRKQIPFFKAGSAIRYNWPSVVASLEGGKKC